MMLFNPAINPSIKQQQPQSESAVGSPTLRFKLKPLSPRINPILSNEKSIQVPIPNHIELKNDSVTPKNQPIILVNDLDKSKQSITSSEPSNYKDYFIDRYYKKILIAFFNQLKKLFEMLNQKATKIM